MISADALHAVAVLAPPGYRAGPLDVLRRLGIAAVTQGWLTDWAKAFWTSEAIEGLRQPEPGCSHPTFVASHADVAVLSARALTALAPALAESDDAASGFPSPSHPSTVTTIPVSPGHSLGRRRTRLPDLAQCLADATGWVRAGSRERSPEHETGGLLFGEFDETLGIAWVTNVSGPPQDSDFSAEHFHLRNARDGRSVRRLQAPHARNRALRRNLALPPCQPCKVQPHRLCGHRHHLRGSARRRRSSTHGDCRACGRPTAGTRRLRVRERELAAHRTGIDMAIEVRGGVTIPPPVARPPRPSDYRFPAAARAPSHSISAPCALSKTSGCSMTST